VTTSPDDQRELEKEIEQTREQLGATVEALTTKVDVKATAGVIGALVLFFTRIRRWMWRDK